jgi:tetratricopeptide (TPR) repeat protein
MKSRAQLPSSEMLKEGQKAFFSEPPDISKAKDCFRRATELAPDLAEGYHWLASALEALKDHGQAARAYREAIRRDGKDPRSKIALGRLLTSMGHLKEAIIELQEGVALKPHYGEADARIFLAEAYEKAKRLPAAIEQRKIVETMEPSYPSYDLPMQEARRKLEITEDI